VARSRQAGLKCPSRGWQEKELPYHALGKILMWDRFSENKRTYLIPTDDRAPLCPRIVKSPQAFIHASRNTGQKSLEKSDGGGGGGLLFDRAQDFG